MKTSVTVAAGSIAMFPAAFASNSSNSLQLAAGTDLYRRTLVDAAATGIPAPNPSQVPGPATAALLGAGLLGLNLFRRRQA